MASVRNIGLTNEEKKAENERNQDSAMSVDASQTTHNRTPPRDAYWFAHGGIEDTSSKNTPDASKSAGTDDPKDVQLQKDKEERVRVFREQQEEERLKKLKDMEQQFLQAKKHREQQEEERKRRIEEARIKEMERRQQVEERKRQIWEAEQERKEAILRRNMEREARIEARRNAQRNSQCFAFGSSTPRTFDLDLAAIGVGRNTSPGSVLMSSVSGRRSEERELGPPRATSACSLDRKFEPFSHDANSYDQRDLSRSMSLEPSQGRISNLYKQIALHHKSSNDMKACLSMWDNNLYNRPNYFDSTSSGWLVGSGVIVGEDCMSRSMVSLSSSAFRGRKRTDIMPTLTRERSITPHVTPRGNCMRAVSMTRLDQLAQPRRPYRDTRTLYSSTTTTSNGGPRAISPSMTKSMCNLAIAPSGGRRSHAPISSNRRGNMSQSMLHLADTPQKDTRGLTPSPTLPKSGMRSAQSMMHLAAPPRLTRTARLRADALAKSRALSAWNLNKPDTSMSGRFLSPGKDSSRSPSRPQSSMSGASEISATSSSISAVNMRTRSAPRRPRPYSIAGSSTERTPIIPTNAVKKEPERQPRLIDKTAQPSATPKQPRMKSINQEKSEEKEISKPKKPVPPPKSKEVLARAKSHPVPTKDNLRKPVKPTPSEVLKASSEKQLLNKERSIEEKENIQIKVVNSSEPKSEPVAEIVNSSPVTSPVTDSDMCISSEDSRPITESDFNTQTFTESEGRTDASESVNIPKEKQEVIPEVLSKAENIPDKPAENVINQETAQQNVSELESTTVKEMVPQKPRITSEEEARAALAEKRRLAREQAEKEAELERQRQEEIRRKEEEQRRLEELEQKRMEEEAMRLAELHRQLEAEKLKKAIEEQQQREREEQERREEEARQKAEKEEQEKKAREDAEKQRLELEERLRKEEEERAERKRRVEQIMARTRGKAAAQSPASTPSENNNKPLKADDSAPINNAAESIKANLFSSTPDSKTTNHINGSVTENNENSSLSTSISNNCVSSVNSLQILEEKKLPYSAPLPDLVNNDVIANHSVKNNGHHVESDEQLMSSKISVSNSFSSSRTLSANDATSPAQTNGYSSHEDMSCTTSPEETSDAGLLIDVESSSQNAARNTSEPADFTKLVDIDPSSLSLDNENYLISVDNVNSNILSPEKSYTGFEDCLQKKPDAPVVDLLSS